MDDSGGTSQAPILYQTKVCICTIISNNFVQLMPTNVILSLTIKQSQSVKVQAFRKKSVGDFFGRKRDASSREAKCKDFSEKAFREYCKEAKDEIPSCYQFYPTTTSTTEATTTSKNMVPFIFGGVIAIIVLLAIGIGIYCYCKNRKSFGTGQSMAGT
ncbi:unnamed protein product [Caenorhabditis nigoni]